MTKVITNDATAFYAPMFKAWGKQHGSKPTIDMLNAVHGLKARPGKQALAIAMALRPEGVTGSQIILACGAPQLNKMRGYIADSLLKRLPAPPSAEGHQVYRLELTAKGKQRIASTEKQAAELDAKGKAAEAAPKAAKAKAKPATKRASKAAKPVETAPEAVVTIPVETATEVHAN